MFSSSLPLQRKAFGPIAELLNRPPVYVKKIRSFCITMNSQDEIQKNVQQFSSSYYYLPKPPATTGFYPSKKC